MLNAGANINYVNNKGETPLGIALSYCSRDIALRLLDLGAMPSKETSRSILYNAISKKDTELAIRLLNAGADIHKTGGSYHQTVLDLAISRAFISFALRLLDLGADINKSYDEVAATPLFTAIDEGHESFALTLLERGADVNKHATEYTIPLISAIEKGYINIVARLLELGADTTVINSEGLTIFQLAEGNDAILGLLQDHEAKLSQESSSGSRLSF